LTICLAGIKLWMVGFNYVRRFAHVIIWGTDYSQYLEQDVYFTSAKLYPRKISHVDALTEAHDVGLKVTRTRDRLHPHIAFRAAR
jgi:hypothetical protein